MGQELTSANEKAWEPDFVLSCTCTGLGRGEQSWQFALMLMLVEFDSLPVTVEVWAWAGLLTVTHPTACCLQLRRIFFFAGIDCLAKITHTNSSAQLAGAAGIGTALALPNPRGMD